MRFALGTLALIPALLLSGCGGGDGTGPNRDTPDPAVTGIGTPIGGIETATIGAGGGTLQSADDRVTITIPAGALSADLQIGIQQISAESPGAVAAYRFTPDGTVFAQPVTVQVTYDSVMVDGSAPELMMIATQEADGSWGVLDNVTVNAADSTIQFSTTHFSDYTSLQGLQIRPPSATINTGESVTLTVRNCINFEERSGSNYSGYAINCDDADDLPPLPSYRIDHTTWAANGVRGGNAAVGFVAGENASGEYVAPQNPPAGNPVAVSVKVRNGSGSEVTSLVANIRIRNTCEIGSSTLHQALRADCFPSRLLGTASTMISDAVPVYTLDVDVTWDLDPAMTTATHASYRASGTSRFRAINTCISISPENHSWNQDDASSGGTLEINLEDSTWTVTGISLWAATYQDTCEEESGSFEAAAGGAFVSASGVVDSAFSYHIGGTQSSSGQTFTFNFGPPGPPTARMSRRQ